jgi:hypothetical protein
MQQPAVTVACSRGTVACESHGLRPQAVALSKCMHSMQSNRLIADAGLSCGSMLLCEVKALSTALSSAGADSASAMT